MSDDFPDLRPYIADIAHKILGEPNRGLSTRDQLRYGSCGSLAIEIAGPKRGRWYDHEAGVGGGPWELLREKLGLSNSQVAEWLERELGIKREDGPKTNGDATKSGSRIVTIYDYRNETGALLFQVCRYEPKGFRQRRPDRNGGWIWQVKGSRQVPYRLPELIASPADVPVYIVEGEKDADRLAAVGLVATCNPGGAAKANGRAKSKSKWSSELNQFFSDRDVTIIPDNDDAGYDHARSIAANLTTVVARVRIFALPGVRPKGDISDWLDAGGSREELERLAADAPPFQVAEVPAIEEQANALGDAAEIARLAKLPLVAYGRERKLAAERLGCPLSMLDRAVAAERDNGGAPGQGRPLDLPEPKPWPDPVDGTALLDELAGAIRNHVVIDLHEANAVALWVLGVHAFDVWVIFPRLFITAPEKQCGKTTLLDALSRLVPRRLIASSITAAALFRTIEAACPTLLLDEADAYLRDNEELRAVVDAGHRRDGAVVRTVGDNHEPRLFSAFAPMALAAIGRLPGTIEDRSIIARLRRRRPDEPVEPLRLDRTKALDVLARKAVRWVADQREALAVADPVMPAGVYNRAADNWRPLLAVADLAGGNWADRARESAVALLSGDEEDSESARVLLLGDLRELFEAEPDGVLFTKGILASLHKNETRPWPEWRGKPITDRQLATLLKPYKIKPTLVRRGSDTGRGYELAWFEDAFARYLSPARSVTALQTRNPAGFEPPRSVTTPSVTPSVVTDENRGKPSISAGCNAVTDELPLPWSERI
jgi:hypothetical protein